MFSTFDSINIRDNRLPQPQHLINDIYVCKVREILNVRRISENFIAVFVKDEYALCKRRLIISGFEHPFLGLKVIVSQIDLTGEGYVVEPVQVVIYKDFDIV